MGPRVRAAFRAAAFLAAAGLRAQEKPAPPAKVPPDHAEAMARGLELWKSRVRGVLGEQCLKCHGGERTRGGLDLSTREGLLRGGEGGPAVVPGSARASRLFKLVTHAEKPHMPQKAPRLPAEAIERLAAWIDAGAPYDRPLVEGAKGAEKKRRVTGEDLRFWSFRPLAPVEAPAVKDEAWCRTPVDRFILARLEERGIAPNPPAERRKVIRRVAFGLTGLPPPPEEVEAFVGDAAPGAYDRLLDRLLASPHHGERWARHWLDLARFAESHGFEHDYDRPSAYHYRDFVIRALNEDMPFDRFVSLQIAGDEVEPESPLAWMATGFLAAGVHSTQITANQVEKERYDELDDIVATIGTSMLGLTIGCARCHDHKFDPIPQEDYYRLVSTFTRTVRSELDLDLDPERTRRARAEYEREHAPLAAALERFEREELPGRLEGWLASGARAERPPWLVVEKFEEARSQGGAALQPEEDGSLLLSGKNPKHETLTLTARTPLQGITALRLEALAHPSLVRGGPGRAANGNFALSDLRLTAAPADGKGEAVPVKLQNPRATFEQKGLAVKGAIDGDPKTAWAVDPQFGKDHAAVFDLEAPLGDGRGTVLALTLKFEVNEGHGVGRPRLSLATAASPAELDGESGLHGLWVEAERILALPAERRGADDRARLSAWYRTIDPEWRRLKAALDAHRKQEPRPELTKVLVSSEGLPAVRLHTQGGDFLEATHFLHRGDPRQKEGEAKQGFLQVLMRAAEKERRWQSPPPPGSRTPHLRAAIARWLTDVESGAGHLLARVIANRLWQHHLGRGLVATPSDFGAQGERPTHPELLDWLAGELVREGWRLRPLHKLILKSAVYLQGTESDAARAAVDPEGKLLWRRSRRRLEGEAIRDAMLAASGLLDRRMFGPGTLDEGNRRRSIYFTMKRSQLIPMLLAFDGPDGNQPLGNRAVTTIAPQALLIMNNPHVLSWAKGFAGRLLPAGRESPERAVREGYAIALGRPPAEEELQEAAAFLGEQTASYRSSGKSDALELALCDFCQSLFGLNEFIYVD